MQWGTPGREGGLFGRLMGLARSGEIRTKTRTFSRGEVVFHEGDLGDIVHLVEFGLFAVRTGSVAGRSLIITVLGPGSIFGEFAVFSSEGRRTSSVTSFIQGTTIAIEKNDLREALSTTPELGEELIAAVVIKAEATRARLVELLSIPADLRVLRALLLVAELDPGDGSVPLTQADLASLAATTRPTANRVLREEAERGTLRLSRGGLVVLDLERLTRRARVRPSSG